MDLSGLIFVGLAVCWAGYLIPKALAHHDEMARSRSVDDFSHKLRVLHRRTQTAVVDESGQAAGAELPAESGRVHAARPTRVQRRQARRAVRAARPVVQHVHQGSRVAARRAAQRRRRVLALLTIALLGVVAAGYLRAVPWWSLAVPGALIVAFLVIARISVRRTSLQVVAQSVAATPAAAPPAESLEDEEQAGVEDTVGVSRAELDAALAGPSAAEGSLWDPLPVTLPTYVGKARARRTVRTIEFSAEVTSSARDAADSALVREAEAAQAAAKAADALPTTQAKAAGA